MLAIMNKRLFANRLNRAFLFLIALFLQNFSFAGIDNPVATSRFRHFYTTVQDIIVKGVVRDAGGNALAGATVTEKGTNNTVIAGNRGDFSITVKEGARLVVTFIGFEMQEVPITDGRDMVITLVLQDRSTDEVVVTALGI